MTRVDFRNEYAKTVIEYKTLQERLKVLENDIESYNKLKYITSSDAAKLILLVNDSDRKMNAAIDQLHKTIAIKREHIKKMEEFMLSSSKSLSTFTELQIFTLVWGSDLSYDEIGAKLGYSSGYIKKIKHKIDRQLNY